MGLTVAVGLLAQNLAEADEDERSSIEAPFVMLNEILSERGMPRHEEPRTIAHQDYFECQMWGYSGLHALRRMASYLELKREPPPHTPYGSYNDDPISIEFNRIHEAYLTAEPQTGPLSFLRKRPRRPRRPSFQHLIMHSDAEGFYIPQMFDDVIVDWTQPQKPGLGMMIGSAAALLQECRVLSAALEIPDKFDPEADEFLELMENPPSFGPPWRRLPVETHTAANLIAACEVSLRTKAAVQFT